MSVQEDKIENLSKCYSFPVERACGLMVMANAKKIPRKMRPRDREKLKFLLFAISITCCAVKSSLLKK